MCWSIDKSQFWKEKQESGDLYSVIWSISSVDVRSRYISCHTHPKYQRLKNTFKWVRGSQIHTFEEIKDVLKDPLKIGLYVSRGYPWNKYIKCTTIYCMWKNLEHLHSVVATTIKPPNITISMDLTVVQPNCVCSEVVKKEKNSQWLFFLMLDWSVAKAKTFP